MILTKTLHAVRFKPEDWQLQVGGADIGCSVGIMAHNEEANIGRTLRAVLEQHGPSLHIKEVIVVASGCTDHTVQMVEEIAFQDPRVRLCIQEKREGKASAINLFLNQAICAIVIVMGATFFLKHLLLNISALISTIQKLGWLGASSTGE